MSCLSKHKILMMLISQKLLCMTRPIHLRPDVNVVTFILLICYNTYYPIVNKQLKKLSIIK